MFELDMLSYLMGKKAGGGSVEGVHTVTFMSDDGSKVLYKRPVADGDNCADVIARGLLETPTKEGTAEAEYAFSGWTDSIGGSVKTTMFEAVKNDLTVYAVFESFAIIDSGECGESAYWRLNEAGTLTVYGTGAMTDFTTADEQPWAAHKADITSVVVEEGITATGMRAFMYTAAKNIQLPKSLETINRNIAYQCTSLENINIPDGVTSIGVYSFYQCTSLENINIPGGVTNIGMYSFYQCTSLSTVILANGLTVIGESAFGSCSSLESIAIPNSVTNVERGAFSSTGLTSIIIPSTVTSLGIQVFQNCKKLKTVTFENSLSRVTTQMFSGCSALASIDIPDSVTVIDGMAFSACEALTQITIPKNVVLITANAFSSCSNLASATFEITSGWWVSKNLSDTSGTNISSSNLGNATTAATYLKSTYLSQHWHRS